MTCERCKRPMQFAADAGDWGCAHCHHRMPAVADTLPQAPAFSAATLAAAPAASPPPVASAPPAAPGVPAPAPWQPRDDTQPVVLPPARRPLLVIAAGVLAMIAVGMIGAVLVRCTSGAAEDALDRDRILALTPADTGHIRGWNWYGLGRTPLGRELRDQLDVAMVDRIARPACGVGVADVVDWRVAMTDASGGFGGRVEMWGLAVDRGAIEECLGRMVRQEGERLTIDEVGKLRGYRVDDQTFWVAWLDARTPVHASLFGDTDDARARLGRVVEGAGAIDRSAGLARAVERVDTGASFWVAMVRPRADAGDDFDEGGASGLSRWYDARLSGLLGSRPHAIYLSFDVRPGAIEVRGGAFFRSDAKAERVAERVRGQIEAEREGGIALPSMDRLDPTLRDDIARRMRQSARTARALRGAIVRNARISVDGELVSFSAQVRGADLEALGQGRGASALAAELESFLPSELYPRH